MASLPGERNLGQTLARPSSGSLLISTSILTVLIIGFLGVASGVINVGCIMTGSCKAPATPAEVAVAKLQPPVPVQAQPAVQMVKPVVQKTAPSLTHNDVLAATFAQLKVELKAPTANSTTTEPKTAVATASVPAVTPLKPAVTTIKNDDTGLTTRVVRAITVKPDGTPDFGSTVAEAYAAPSAPVVPPSPAVDAAARIGAGQLPLVDSEPVNMSPAKTVVTPKAAAADTKVASTGGGGATVTGAGANVRSSPSKGGKVLFALSGGETVSVLENKRGWLRIKDDQGRTGWVYSDGVKRG